MTILNPRVQRDDLKAFMGKKVMIGTHTYHYISGYLEALNEQNQLEIKVNGKTVRIQASDLATIQEVPACQAEYIK